MKKRMLNWGLIFSLLLTQLPVPVAAAGITLSEDGYLPAEIAAADADTAGSSTYTVEEDTSPLIPITPAISCTPLDEESSSDMVLTVEGDWDSYAWEACAYGSWFDWEGDGPSLILTKEEFTSYAFRCTVTWGEQSVTSEIFAYDPSVMERPPMMANSLSDDALSGSSAYIKFGKRLPNSVMFDIKGLDEGHEIRTTYADAGYRTAISVNGGTKRSVFYKDEPISVGNSLTAQTRLEIVYGGRYVKVTYEVKNNGSTPQEFRIGSSADVMIDNNDYAKVVGVQSSSGKYTGLSMSGSPKNEYEFRLVAPDCDALWYGYYSQAYVNIFNDRANKSTPYSKDSGMAWSWADTVAPGQTWSRYVLIGAGELPPEPGAPLINDFPTLKAGEEFTISGTVGSGDNQPDTVYVSIGGEEYQAGVNPDGTFTVTGILPEDLPAGETALTYWGTTEEGGISEIKSGTATVVAAPFISLTTNSVTVMEGETGLNEAWLEDFIKSNSDKVDISPDTVDTSAPGKKTIIYKVEKEGFTPATDQLEVTVLPQPAKLSGTSVAESESGEGFDLSATMIYTGGLEYKETGFVYGALPNPTLTVNDGKVATDPAVDQKGGKISARVDGGELAYGVNYYARAYAIDVNNTVIYGDQSQSFGVDAAQYGTFSVKNNRDNTFTITREGGFDGDQTVYYRTVNGSAIGQTHFEHQYGKLEFKDGDTNSQVVSVTEYSVTTPYGDDNAATAYSNADRTYSLEIYRVTGGATIKTRQATRTMDSDPSYLVGKEIYQETSRPVDTSENNYVSDCSGSSSTNDYVYFKNNRGKNEGELNFHVTRALDVGTEKERKYLKSTAEGFLYSTYFEFTDDEDTSYHHIWIANQEPTNVDSPYKGKNEAIPLTGTTFGEAIYTAKWQRGEPNQTIKLPDGTGTGITGLDSNGGVNGIFLEIDETAHVWFSATGSGENVWHMTKYTDYLKVQDSQEPQLLGMAPMAGGSYMPGDSVTVSLVFDEIVDGQNSTVAGLGGNSTITTSWGTFRYAGGADTNVLYFTGTVPDDADSTISLRSLDCAGQIKDMCDTQNSTISGGGGSTDVALGTGNNAPTVTVGEIDNNNGTLSATVSTGTAGAKLEYVWSDSSQIPTTGWQIVSNGSTVFTRKTGGTWYLHARATVGDGVTTYDSNFYSFSSGEPVQPPSLTVQADNLDWAKTREIKVDRYPDNAKVTVKTPDGSDETVQNNTYIAEDNGTYIFILESGDTTITQMVPVSKLDTTAPTVEIVDLDNTTHTEAVTLTVRVSDGESGIGTVTRIWSNGSEAHTESLAVEDGVCTTTAPYQTGTWTLTVTAEDRVGNTGTDFSSGYTINADRPGLTVTRDDEASSDKGIVYHYTVAENGNTGIIVALPDGSTTTKLGGTFTITEPGDYIIAVTDAAGHFVSEPISVTVSQGEVLDGVAPDVRLSIADESWTKGPVEIAVSVYDAGSAGKGTLTAKQGDGTIQLAESDEEPGAFTGSFSVSTNGGYTVTCADAAGNEGSGTIGITNIDTTAPTIAVSGNPETWKPSDVTITLTVEDTQSGVGAVEVKKGESTIQVNGDNGSYTFTTSGNGVYIVTATDRVGNQDSKSITVDKIDKDEPVLVVEGGQQSAASLELTVNATSGSSGVTVTVTKDGQAAATIEPGSYQVNTAGTYKFTATTGAGKSTERTVRVYSITFQNDSAPYETHLVSFDGTVTRPAGPAKAGYDLAGWRDGAGLWDFEENTVGENLVLTAEWALKPPTVTLIADPEDGSGTYNGGNPVVTLTAKADHDADVTYSYEWYRGNEKLSAQSDTVTVICADVADQGDYTVKVIANDGRLTSQQVTSNVISVSIAKANPVTQWPAASDITYGQSLKDSDFSGGAAVDGTFTWVDETIVPESGTHGYTVRFTPTDKANYETVEQTVMVTVDKAILVPDVFHVEDKEYDGRADTQGTISLTGGVNGEKPAASGVFTFANADVGVDKAVRVVVTLDGSWGDNYVLSTQELYATASITPRTVGLAWHGYENLTYTGQPVNVTAEATGLVSGDECAVIVEGGDEIAAGEYTAKATGLTNPNYQLPADGTTRQYTIAQAAGAARVTMAGWTYGDEASTPVPESATHGTDSVTYHYTGTTAGSVDYDSGAAPTDAGQYVITATFAATDNYAAVTATSEFTVAKKPILAAWLGLDQVYGDEMEVQVKLSGVVDGDQTTAKVNETVPSGVGSHKLTAALIGDDASNYILTNSAATLTIQPKPVIFTVAGNSVQADGSEKNASITADDTNCAYTVTYRKDGEEVASHKDVGNYEIWVNITDPNYRHTNGNAEMQIGTLTITQAPPVMYTVSFTGGENTQGTPPAVQSAVRGGQITLPANPFTKEKHLFIGWMTDGDTRLYQPGEPFTLSARNVTFTAQWQAVFEVSGTITEKVDGEDTKVENAVVSLWLGANKINEVTTGDDGIFQFENLVPGIYNLVVTKDVRTVTSKVELTTENKTCHATLPKGATNSILEVTPGSPDIVVGELDTIFNQTDETVYTEDDQTTVDAGGKVEITFLADEKQRGDETIAEDMEKITATMNSSVAIGLVMDYTLEKTVTQADGTPSEPIRIPQSNVLLEVLLPLPAQLQGKQSYSVYRVHGGAKQELTETPSADLGEYFTVDSDKTSLTLYVKCFSTYAIGYTEYSGGGSGGGSSTPVYPPSIEQTENGSVTIVPQRPQKGDQVTITPAPEEGFTVDEVIVTDPDGKPIAVAPNGDGTYTFTQPSGNVTVKVTFRAVTHAAVCSRDESCPMTPFTDADMNAWYHDGVHYCVENGLMTGTSKTTFAPNAATTRGMIVTILWRLQGSPIVSNSVSYHDVKQEDWYWEAVCWADHAGIVTGYGNGTFGPNDPITREQLAAMLWRYAGSSHMDGSLASFVDGAQTSSWAQPAMIWAVEQGLIAGGDNEQLNPRGQATRAQSATILMQFAKHLAQ